MYFSFTSASEAHTSYARAATSFSGAKRSGTITGRIPAARAAFMPLGESSKTVISAGPGTVGSKKRECEICHEEETATIPAMPAPMDTLPDGGTETQPSTDAPSDDGNPGGGCGGFTVASSLIALICAAGAAIVIKRK